MSLLTKINVDTIEDKSISLSKIKENLNELYSNINHTHNEFLNFKNIIESLIDRIEIIEQELNIDCVEDCSEDCLWEHNIGCGIDEDNDNKEDEWDDCIFDNNIDGEPESY